MLAFITSYTAEQVSLNKCTYSVSVTNICNLKGINKVEMPRLGYEESRTGLAGALLASSGADCPASATMPGSVSLVHPQVSTGILSHLSGSPHMQVSVSLLQRTAQQVNFSSACGVQGHNQVVLSVLPLTRTENRRGRMWVARGSCGSLEAESVWTATGVGFQETMTSRDSLSMT